MSVVLDDAFEVDLKTETRKSIGRILLKGENITLLQAAQEEWQSPKMVLTAGTIKRTECTESTFAK